MTRHNEAYNLRVNAANIARNRQHPKHENNGDENRYHLNGDFTYIGSFTKALTHDSRTGLVANPGDFRKFIESTEDRTGKSIRYLPLYNGPFRSAIAEGASVRAWESMGAGLAYDLQGPDAQAVTMPPVPTLESDEVHLEMAEVYWQALLRDVPLSLFSNEGRQVVDINAAHPYRPSIGNLGSFIFQAVDQMNSMEWMKPDNSVSGSAAARKRDMFYIDTVFRGILPGDNIGPYLSQFMLIGTTGLGDIYKPEDGIIQFGAMNIDQRVRMATPGVDYMTNWAQFMDVQNGVNLSRKESFDRNNTPFRFITSGRDLATYVHYDALYQAYLNACLIMLDNKKKYPFDEGIPYGDDDSIDKQTGFALFGAPHILTLITEVSTRALKAVRYQKFNNHRRLRPEKMAGILDRHLQGEGNAVINQVGGSLENALRSNLIEMLRTENEWQNNNISDTVDGREVSRLGDLALDNGRSRLALLPMAFPEGSPVHPAYGSGHATVGGACITILKAFFDTTATLDKAFVVNGDGSRLVEANLGGSVLTVEGELNKLCSNIAVGRNWAGVHWFSDYYESVLLGEKVALGILEEQMNTYGEDISMTVPMFNGKQIAKITKSGIEYSNI